MRTLHELLSPNVGCAFLDLSAMSSQRWSERPPDLRTASKSRDARWGERDQAERNSEDVGSPEVRFGTTHHREKGCAPPRRVSVTVGSRSEPTAHGRHGSREVRLSSFGGASRPWSPLYGSDCSDALQVADADHASRAPVAGMGRRLRPPAAGWARTATPEAERSPVQIRPPRSSEARFGSGFPV